MTDTIQLQLTALRSAVARDREITLDILATIRTPEVTTAETRPSLNLALVIDRSGSMAGHKLAYAKQAVQYALQQLRDRDRASITIFDNEVQVLVPSTLVQNREGLCQLVERIKPGGSTALHKGWQVGADQAKAHLDTNAMNRTLLLSDGLANVGETNPDIIATDVSRREQQGVSTTTIGVGADYDEDLLSAMAASGSGNFYHIEDPSTIPSIFATELQGLVATVGDQVRLAAHSPFNIKDCLNDLPQDEQGQYRLLPLRRGHNHYVVFRVEVPACETATDVLTLTLRWQQDGQSYSLSQTLNLPALPWAELEQLPADPLVTAHIQLLNAARARAEAQTYLEKGDFTSSRQAMRRARADINTWRQSLPLQDLSTEDAEYIEGQANADLNELESLDDLFEDADAQSPSLLRKRMMSQRMRKQRGSDRSS